MAVFTLIERSSIQVCGPEAVHFLHNLVTTDIEGLPEGEIRPGALLSPQGKILFDFLVSRSGDRFSLECRSDIAAELAKRLKFYRLRAKVEIELLEQALVSASVDADSSASENDSTAQWLVDGRFFGSIKVYRSYSASAAKVDLERTYDALRIAHGVAEGGSDYEFGDAFPHDANLDQTRGLSFSKGCYVGQEVVSRMQHRNTARRRTVLVTANDDLAARAAVTAGGRKIGKLGTVVGFKALALVRIDKAKEAMDAGTPVFADHIKINVDLPPKVTFGWPDSGEVLE